MGEAECSYNDEENAEIEIVDLMFFEQQMAKPRPNRFHKFNVIDSKKG